MKTILIPTDFSDNAGDALAYALAFIGNNRANIHIIKVIDTSVTLPSLPDDRDDILVEYIKDAQKSMAALEGFSKSFFGDEATAKITVATHVEVGRISDTIKKQAAKLKADLIIMGTQGANHTYIEKRIGSISTEILKNAPCPVILIPREYKFKAIDNLLFATNLNHGDPYELWRATELIKPHVAVVRCLHIVEKAADGHDEHLEKFAKYMVEHSPSVQTIFNIEESEDVEAAIVEYAEAYDVELVIMHKAKRSFWEQLFAYSHTKRMAFKLEVPLLVMNNDGE